MRKIVMAHRSLAENDPMNLKDFPACREFILKHGEEKFKSTVWSILDETE